MSEPFSDKSSETDLLEKQRKQLILDYKATFNGERGARVLNDLKRKFGFQQPTADAGVSLEEVYRRESMKHPLYHIEKMRSYEFKEPKKKVPNPTP